MTSGPKENLGIRRDDPSQIFGFRAIEPQSITGHPRLNAIEAAGESSFKDRDIGNGAVVVDLEVVRVTVNPKPRCVMSTKTSEVRRVPRIS